MDTLKPLLTNDPKRLVRFNQAKIYVDGILGQATSAMLQPYEARLRLPVAEAHGYLYFPKDRLCQTVRVLTDAGF